MRYHAKIIKSRLATYATNARIKINAEINDTMRPTAITVQSSDPCNTPRLCHKSSKPAPIITGIPKKKENSVADLRDKPSIIPPIMVAPERDVPGINDKT
ncbi:hypothetical protein GWI33_010967 [Rhynchophorus ferrugineus]|uniref:Uncharacterized protein n=1 Tax=Rhynchophorus ferrugineus TaxID=354439 RepID=A0A834M8U2_RHYFE|nr:hypothetical protein GWI33_010967 [Rhynchophorus ferrugineus]